jgi:HPt (histidine-containing phosphotransfer) domain-containing protein
MTVSAPLMLPSAADEMPATIDEAHLHRMTLGDRSLEREVLEIFGRQTVVLLGRMAGAEPAFAAAAAHTLKGSAHGVGAWRVAQAAERVEQAARDGRGAPVKAAIAELEAACSEVRAAIGARLGHGADDVDAAIGDLDRATVDPI